AVVRIPAIDLELARLRGAGRLRPGLAAADPRIFRKCEFNHGCVLAGTKLRHSGMRPLGRRPGIHNPQSWLWIPGSLAKGSRPGMTMYDQASFFFVGRGVFWCAARSASDQRDRRSWK